MSPKLDLKWVKKEPLVIKNWLSSVITKIIISIFIEKWLFSVIKNIRILARFLPNIRIPMSYRIFEYSLTTLVLTRILKTDLGVCDCFRRTLLRTFEYFPVLCYVKLVFSSRDYSQSQLSASTLNYLSTVWSRVEAESWDWE